jgi:DNA-binding XRE family transcriptional regulator
MLAFSPDKLREARKRRQMTQRMVGEQVGASERQYQFWENGQHEPSATYLLRMMVLLECEAAQLLDATK